LIHKSKREKDSTEEFCGFGVGEDSKSFDYWYRVYQKAPCIQAPGENGRLRILPSYAKETALFRMAAYAEDEWQRLTVIEEFLKEYGP